MSELRIWNSFPFSISTIAMEQHKNIILLVEYLHMYMYRYVHVPVKWLLNTAYYMLCFMQSLFLLAFMAEI